MTLLKPLVVDANILMRGVLGSRVRELFRGFAGNVEMYVPDVALRGARRHLTSIVTNRDLDLTQTLLSLSRLETLVEVVDQASYVAYGVAAKRRIAHRDSEDWPIIATALLLNAPIWTEDQDFFGCGVAVWITATVDLYLRP